MRNVYDDNVVVTVIKTNSLPLTLGHKGRRLLQATEVNNFLKTMFLKPMIFFPLLQFFLKIGIIKSFLFLNDITNIYKYCSIAF